MSILPRILEIATKKLLIRGLLIRSGAATGKFASFSRLKRSTHLDFQKLVGNNLRRLRKDMKLSQDDFADLAGLHRAYVGAVERGERNVTLSTIVQIATALKTTPDVLLQRV